MTQTKVREVAAADGVRLALHDFGGQGRPCLLLHGLTANGPSMLMFARYLKEGHRVFALDFRGRGRSGDSPAGTDLLTHAEDARGALRALRGDLGQEPDLLGHSMGALVALILAADEEPLMRRVVLVDGAGDVEAQDLEAIRPSLARLEAVIPDEEAYLGAMRAAPHLRPWNEALEAFARADMRAVAGGGVRSRISAAAILGEMERNNGIRLAPCQGRVRRPVLIVRAPEPVARGTLPVFAREAALRAHAAIPLSLLVEVPHAHHYSIALQEQPVVREAVRAFLAEGEGETDESSS